MQNQKLTVKRFGKRALSLLLAAIMLFSSVDITALATEPDTSTAMETTVATDETVDENQMPDEFDESGGLAENEQDQDKVGESGEDSNLDDIDPNGQNDSSTEASNPDDSEEEKADETQTAGKAAVKVDNSNMSIEASNAIGGLLLSDIEIAAAQEQEELEKSYNISDIEMTGATAKVRFNVADYSTVVVGIYDEDSKAPLAYGSAPVDAGETYVDVEIETDDMPECFIIKAYIVDTDSLRPLSEEYVSTMYTKAMQDFLKKTTGDFDSEKVVNLDEDDKTNFLVVKNDNLLIKPETADDENIVNELVDYDEDKNTYTFANADENIINLSQGDIFVYEYGENDFLIIKVKSIKQNEIVEEETVYDIEAYKEELNVDDVFQYVKIEESMGTADMDEIDPESCPEGVTYLGRGEVSENVTYFGRDAISTYASGGISTAFSKDNWTVDFDQFKAGGNLGPIEGTVEGKISASIGIEISFNYYFDVLSWIFEVDFNVASEASFGGNIDAEGKISVPLVSAPQIKRNGVLTIEYLPEFVIDLSFHGKVSADISVGFGVTLGNQGNLGPHFDYKIGNLEVSAEIDGYIGFDFSPKFAVENMFNAELESGVHLGVKASASAGVTGWTNAETEGHECGDLCISGEIYIDIPFDGSLKVAKFEEWNLSDNLDIGGSLFNKTLGGFYYSIKHGKFGWGTCPYREYKITVVIKRDAKSHKPYIPIAGAKIMVNGTEGVTDKNGGLDIWLPSGRYVFDAEYDGSKSKKTVEIDGSKQVILYLNVMSDDSTKVKKFFGASGAIMENGSLYTWGNIENGSTDSQKIPYKVMENVKDAGSYAGVNYVLKEDGSLYIWGSNYYGQVGNGTTDNQSTPYKVMEGVREAGLYFDTCYAIKTDGSLYMWGSNYYGQIGNGTPLNYTEKQTTPYKVLDNVRDTGSDDRTCYAITTDGSLYVWGSNYFGQDDLENGDSAAKYRPYKVMENVRAAGLDNGAIYAITTGGSLYMWGHNSSGQIGNGSSVDYPNTQKTPYKVLDNVKAAGMDAYTSYAITTDGKLYMWGANYYGQVGNGTSGNGSNQTTPYKVLDNVEDAGINNHINYAITTDGELYMWGNNYYGVIGKEESGVQETPHKVFDNVKDAGVFGFTSYAITTDKSLYMWGLNSVGQVGNGNTDDQYTPYKVLDNVKEAGMFGSISHAITTDGNLYMWGNNNGGYIGNGNTDNQYTPYKVQFPIGAKASYTIEPTNEAESTASTESTASHAIAPIANSLSTVHDADTATDNKAVFSNLLPNDIHNIYVMKTKDSEEPLTSDNLLYITQAVSDENGNLSVDYKMTQDYENPAIFCVGFRQTDISSADVTVDDITYDGEAHYPEVIVMYNGQQLEAGTDYEIYGDCSVTDIGEYKILIKGIGIYCGEKILTYRVNEPEPEDISSAEITVSDIVYDGNEHKVKVTVSYNGQILTEGIDYEISGDTLVTEVGEYKVIIKGIGAYRGEKEATFNVIAGDDDGGEESDERDDVLPEDIPADGKIPEGLWIAGVPDEGFYYTGSAIIPEVRVYDHKTLLVEKSDYTIAYKNNTKVNDASVANKAPSITVTGKGNYTGKDTKTFKIQPLDISLEERDNTFEADDISLASTGKALKPVPELYWNDKKLKNKTDYTFTYHEGAYEGTETKQLDSVNNAGNYYIKLIGIGNFTGTRRINLTVIDASSLKSISKVTVTKIPNQSYQTQIKDGAVTPVVTVKDGSTTLTEGVNYTVTYSNNTKVGTAYAIIKGIETGGYSGTKRVAFKITGIAISKATVSGLTGQTFIYNGADIEPELTLSAKINGTDTLLVKGTDYTVKWQNNKKAGTATVIFTGKNGYTGTAKKTLKIKAFNIAENKDGLFKVELKGEDGSDNVSVPYAKGGAKPELAVTFKKSDGTMQTLKEGTDYTVTYKNNKALNDGSNTAKLPTLTIKGKGNFTGTYSQNLTYRIVPQDLSRLKLTAADKTYQNKQNIYSTKVTITDLDDKALKAGTDYDKDLTYTYKNDTPLGNGTERKAGEPIDKADIIPAGTVITVTATPKGTNYTGSPLSGEYSIKTYDISGAKVTIPKQTYTGKAIKLDKTDEKQILVKVKGQKVNSDQFEIVGYTNNVKKGTATVTIKGADNYGGTKTVKFTIKAKGFTWWWNR